MRTQWLLGGYGWMKEQSHQKRAKESKMVTKIVSAAIPWTQKNE
jgi:hypothetical protein